MSRTMLSDDLWDVLEQKLLQAGARLNDNLRNVVEGMLHRIRTGEPWRDLPKDFGPYSTVYNRFNSWSKCGITTALFEVSKFDPDNEINSMDSTINRAHQHASGAAKGEETAIGRSKGGLTTKVHVLADAHGNPLETIVTEGQAHDMREAHNLAKLSEAEIILGDKGYDSGDLRNQIIQQGSQPSIPMKSTSTKENPHFDKEIYKSRHTIENLFAKMKQFRAFATRYDKLKRNYKAVVDMVATMIWLKLLRN